MSSKLMKLYSPFKTNVAKNSYWLFSERILRLIVNLFISIVVARYLGPEDYGKISYVVSIVLLFSFFSQLGVSTICIRDLVANPLNNNTILGTTFTLKLIASLISFILIITLTLFVDSFYSLQNAIIIFSFSILFQSLNVLDFYFQSKLENKYPSIANIIAVLIIGLSNLIFVKLNLNFIYFITSLLLESIIITLILYYFYISNEKIYKKWTFDIIYSKKLLLESWPLIIIGAASIINMKIDQIYIGNMIDQNTLGNYSVAAKIAEGWLIIPTVLDKVTYPVLIKKFKENYITYKKTIIKIICSMSLISLLIAIIISYFSSDIINILYGQKYNTSGKYLALYIWSGIPYVSFFVLGQVFNIEKITKYNTIIALVSILSNIILTYIFIRVYGAIGAVYTTIISAFLTYLTVFIIIQSKTNIFKKN